MQQMAQSKAPIMIWYTPEGLVVGINDAKDVTPQMVAFAIQQYIQEYGLPWPVQVSILGYRNGGVVAQNLATYVTEHPGEYDEFKIDNEVLIGSALVGNPQSNIEYDAYSFSPDLSDSGGWGPLFAPDIPGLATNLPDVPGILISYIEGVAENIYARQANVNQQQLQAMNPDSVYSVQRQAIDRIHLLPDEVGAYAPGLLSNPDYNQSSQLNSVPIPDPSATNQQLPGNNVTRTPLLSTSGQPLPPPASYYVTKGSPPMNSHGTPVPGDSHTSYQ